MSDKQDQLLHDVREWESIYTALYKHRPTMRDREQYFVGRIHGIRWAAETFGPILGSSPSPSALHATSVLGGKT
jgi:hypothetical protein